MGFCFTLHTTSKVEQETFCPFFYAMGKVLTWPLIPHGYSKSVTCSCLLTITPFGHVMSISCLLNINCYGDLRNVSCLLTLCEHPGRVSCLLTLTLPLWTPEENQLSPDTTCEHMIQRKVTMKLSPNANPTRGHMRNVSCLVNPTPCGDMRRVRCLLIITPFGHIRSISCLLTLPPWKIK